MTNGNAGFALIEVAVALIVIAIFLSGVLIPLNSQVQQSKVNGTQKSLDDIKEALLGYVAANGRLPCPASPTSNGVEKPVGGGVCTNPYDGYVPAVTLGLASVDATGNMLDAWNNPIHYAVTTSNASAFTTASGIKNNGMSGLTPDLKVCPSGTSCTTPLATNAPIIIYSTGANGLTGGTSADERENPNPSGGVVDNVFVYHVTSDVSGTEFDDMVTWVSAYAIYTRMVSVGLLP